MIAIFANSEGCSEKPPGSEDPGVRAVDRSAQRREHDEQPEDRRAPQERGVGAQQPVVEPRDQHREGDADDEVDQVLLQERLRVGPGLDELALRRRPHEQRADDATARAREPTSTQSAGAGTTTTAAPGHGRRGVAERHGDHSRTSGARGRRDGARDGRAARRRAGAAGRRARRTTSSARRRRDVAALAAVDVAAGACRLGALRRSWASPGRPACRPRGRSAASWRARRRRGPTSPGRSSSR